jgi:hypothetical protein
MACHSAYSIKNYAEDFTRLNQPSGRSARLARIPPGVLPICQRRDFARTNTYLQLGRESERQNVIWRSARRLALPENLKQKNKNKHNTIKS